MGHWVQDQAENIAGHTGKGIEFLDKFAGLLRDRCNIEAAYAKDLRFLPFLPSPALPWTERGCLVQGPCQEVLAQEEGRGG